MKIIFFLFTISLIVLNSCGSKTRFFKSHKSHYYYDINQHKKNKSLPDCSFTEYETQGNGYVKMNLKGNIKSITETVLSPTRESDDEKYSFKEDSIYYKFNKEGFIIEEKKGISFVDSLDRYFFNYWIHYYDEIGNLMKMINVDTGEEKEWFYTYKSTGKKTNKIGTDYNNVLGYWTYSYNNQTRIDSFFNQKNTLLSTVKYNYKNEVLINKIGTCYDSIIRTIKTDFSYDSLQNKIEEYTFCNDSIWDKTEYQYDNKNREVKFTKYSIFLDNSFSSPGFLHESRGFQIQNYDDKGNSTFTHIHIGIFGLVDKWRTEYIYDNKANWIKASRYGLNSETPFSTIERTIEYFE